MSLAKIHLNHPGGGGGGPNQPDQKTQILKNAQL